MQADRIAATCVAALLVAATAHAAAGAGTVTLRGQAQTASVRRDATLRLACEPAPNGVIEVTLEIPDAGRIGDFDFAPFEGPDAPAASRAASTITVGDDGGHAESARHAAAGWYAADDPGAFVLGVSQRSRRAGRLATLLAAIDPGTRRIAWTQQGWGDRTQTLVATFHVDEATARRLHEAAAPCLVR